VGVLRKLLGEVVLNYNFLKQTNEKLYIVTFQMCIEK
jgi:hypothetical protein